MGKFIDLTGKRFGRLLVLQEGHKNTSDRYWYCRCDCGVEKFIGGHLLRRGTAVSCGCYSVEKAREKATKHGLRGTRLYTIYANMKSRCYNKKNEHFKDYGGRGITICEEWKVDFMAFYTWAMVNGYRDDLTIDRKNSNGNYCPENCRWATQLTQVRNRRNNRQYIHDGLTLCISEWAERTGINANTLRRRLNRGIDFEKAINTPNRQVKDPV
ncbi:hypothetical protein FACS1894106_2710 [Spirochaetia bacterium]|nr:hypothetical protein FACS1894106_2710 [Spirochaetia bacterium]